MMYRPDIEQQLPRRQEGRRRRRGIASLPLWLLLPVVAGMLYVFVWARKASAEAYVETILSNDDAPVTAVNDADAVDKVYRRRLHRDAIPTVDFSRIGYRELFNDSNYVQLSAARANGITPSTLLDPAENDAVVPIFSTRFYKVDSMYHSRPFLVPEALLLLDYIAHRYNEILTSQYPHVDECRPIVTSALRTEQSERRLRRVNRNATDTSCHIYGTTFDLSAQRYEHVASGRDTVVEACKEALARALYEIRYEGLCYVKYERGSCFHITLRTTQYDGAEPSEMRSYVNPGSHDYLLTKAPPRPRRRHAVQPAKQEKTLPAPTKHKKAKKSSRPVKSTTKQKKTTEDKPSKTINTNHIVTDRERLSLEQFERRY